MRKRTIKKVSACWLAHASGFAAAPPGRFAFHLSVQLGSFILHVERSDAQNLNR